MTVKSIPHVEDSLGNHRFVIVWQRAVYYIALYTAATFSTYTFLVWDSAITGICWRTSLFSFSYIWIAGLGMTAGSHRLWTHRSYKAKLPFRIFLMLCYSATNVQGDIFVWIRDHRVHHKLVDTNADPHNIRRGGLFSHMWWYMVRRHPDFNRAVKEIDMSDIENDPVCGFQRKYHMILAPALSYGLPTAIPMVFWGKTFFWSFLGCGIIMHSLTMHLASTVNSIAHLWGYKPYNRHCSSTDSWLMPVSISVLNAITLFYLTFQSNAWLLGLGEGWHNYHHAFPCDYRTSEFFWFINGSTAVIDLMAFIGQVKDKKFMSQEAVESRKTKNMNDMSRFDMVVNHGFFFGIFVLMFCCLLLYLNKTV